jgi:excisionase family DNA binding protein
MNDKNVKSVIIDGVEYINPASAARLLGISRPTLYRMMNDKTLIFIQIPGVNKKWIRRSDVDRLIQATRSAEKNGDQ